MNIYLVQRGKFKSVDIDKITGIDSCIEFDYMGSAEFEFGAKRESLIRIMEQIRSGNFRTYKISINNVDFYVSSKVLLDNGKEIEDFFNMKFKYKYGNPRTKETVNIDEYFKGKSYQQLKRDCKSKMETVDNYFYCDFWWDIENDWWVYPAHQRIVITTALSELDKKGFGK